MSVAPALPPVVVDTDVVSYLFKSDTRAAPYQAHLANRQAVVSFMTVAELSFWTAERNWGWRTRGRLERFLLGFTVRYPDRMLCGLWGTVMTAARRAGRPIGPADAWIAATALRYNIPLVTHNPSDYAGVPGLSLLS